MVTPREIENLFAADLAYLQDVYGAINFGSQDEIDAVVEDAEGRARRCVRAGAGTRAGGRRAGRPTPTSRRGADDDDGVATAMAMSRRRRVEEVGRRQP